MFGSYNITLLGLLFFSYSVYCFIVILKKSAIGKKALYLNSLDDCFFKYIISIRTDNAEGLKSDRGVRVVLNGSYGSSQPFFINSKAVKAQTRKLAFNLKSSSYFLICSKENLGDVESFDLEVVSFGKTDKWDISEVVVIDIQTHRTYFSSAAHSYDIAQDKCIRNRINLAKGSITEVWRKNILRTYHQFHLWMSPISSDFISTRKLIISSILCAFFMLSTTVFSSVVTSLSYSSTFGFKFKVEDDGIQLFQTLCIVTIITISLTFLQLLLKWSERNNNNYIKNFDMILVITKYRLPSTNFTSNSVPPRGFHWIYNFTKKIRRKSKKGMVLNEVSPFIESKQSMKGHYRSKNEHKMDDYLSINKMGGDNSLNKVNDLMIGHKNTSRQIGDGEDRNDLYNRIFSHTHEEEVNEMVSSSKKKINTKKITSKNRLESVQKLSKTTQKPSATSQNHLEISKKPSEIPHRNSDLLQKTNSIVPSFYNNPPKTALDLKGSYKHQKKPKNKTQVSHVFPLREKFFKPSSTDVSKHITKPRYNTYKNLMHLGVPDDIPNGRNKRVFITKADSFQKKFYSNHHSNLSMNNLHLNNNNNKNNNINNQSVNHSSTISPLEAQSLQDVERDMTDIKEENTIDNYDGLNSFVLKKGFLNLDSNNVDLVFTTEKEIEWMVEETKVLCLSEKNCQTHKMEGFEILSHNVKDKLDDIKNEFYLRLKKSFLKNEIEKEIDKNKDQTINQHVSEDVFVQTLLEKSYHQASEYVKKIAEKSYKNLLRTQPTCVKFSSCDELMFKKRLENINQKFLDSIALKSFELLSNDTKPVFTKSFITMCCEDFQILVVNAVDKIVEEVYEQLMKEKTQSDSKENTSKNNDKRFSELKASTISALNLYCLNSFTGTLKTILKRINSFHTIYFNFSFTHNFFNNALIQTQIYMNESIKSQKTGSRNLFNSFQKPSKASSSFLEVLISSELGFLLHELIDGNVGSSFFESSEMFENFLEDPISKISVLMHLFPLDIAYFKYNAPNTWSESYPFASLDEDVLWVKFTCKVIMIYLACFNIPVKYNDDHFTMGKNTRINFEENAVKTSNGNPDVVIENFDDFKDHCLRNIKEFDQVDKFKKKNSLEKSVDDEEKSKESDANQLKLVDNPTHENCCKNNYDLYSKLKNLKELIESHKRNKMTSTIDDYLSKSSYRGDFNRHNTENGDSTSVKMKNFSITDIHNLNENILPIYKKIEQKKHFYTELSIKALLKPNKADKTFFKKLFKMFMKESEDFLKNMVAQKICEHHVKLRSALWQAFCREARREQKEIHSFLQSNLELHPPHSSHASLHADFVSNRDSIRKMGALRDFVINIQNKIITRSLEKLTWNLVEMCCDDLDGDFQGKEVKEFRREVIKLADELNQKILTSCQFYLANKRKIKTYARCSKSLSNNNNENNNNVSDESSEYSFKNDENYSQKFDDSEINVDEVIDEGSDDDREYSGRYASEVNKANNNSMANTYSSRAKIVSSKKSTSLPKPSQRNKNTSSAPKTSKNPFVSKKKIENKIDKPSVRKILKPMNLSPINESLQKNDGTVALDFHDLNVGNDAFMKNWENTDKANTLENLVDELVEEDYEKLISLACDQHNISSNKNLSYNYNLEKIENLISDEIENKNHLSRADSHEVFKTNSLVSEKKPIKIIKNVSVKKREALSSNTNDKKMCFLSDTVGNLSKSAFAGVLGTVHMETTENQIDNFYRLMDRKNTKDQKNVKSDTFSDEEVAINSEYPNLENKKKLIENLIKPLGDQKVFGTKAIEESLTKIIPISWNKNYKREEAKLMRKLKKIYENDKSVKLCEKWAFELTNKRDILTLKNIETHNKDNLEIDFIESEEKNIYIARKRKNLFDSQNYLHQVKSFKATEKRLKKFLDFTSVNGNLEEATSNHDSDESKKVAKSDDSKSEKNNGLVNINQKSKTESFKDESPAAPRKTSSCDDLFEVDDSSLNESLRNGNHESDIQKDVNDERTFPSGAKTESEKTIFSSENDISKKSNSDNTESLSNENKSSKNLSSSKDKKIEISQNSDVFKTEIFPDKDRSSKSSRHTGKNFEQNASSKSCASKLAKSPSKKDTDSLGHDKSGLHLDKSISFEDSKCQSTDSNTNNESSSKRSNFLNNETDKQSLNSSIELENSFGNESLKTSTMKNNPEIESSVKFSKDNSGCESISLISKSIEKSQSTSHKKSFSTNVTDKQSLVKEKSLKSKSINEMGINKTISKKSERSSIKKDHSKSLSSIKNLKKSLISLNNDIKLLERGNETGDSYSNKRSHKQSLHKTLLGEKRHLSDTRSDLFPPRQEVVQPSLLNKKSRANEDDIEESKSMKSSRKKSYYSVNTDYGSDLSSDRSIFSEMQNNRKILNVSPDWNPVLTSITFFLVFLLCCLIFVYSMMLFRSLDGNSAIRCLKTIFYSLLVHFFLIEPTKVFIIATFFSVFSRKIIF